MHGVAFCLQSTFFHAFFDRGRVVARALARYGGYRAESNLHPAVLTVPARAPSAQPPSGNAHPRPPWRIPRQKVPRRVTHAGTAAQRRRALEKDESRRLWLE